MIDELIKEITADPRKFIEFLNGMAKVIEEEDTIIILKQLKKERDASEKWWKEDVAPKLKYDPTHPIQEQMDELLLDLKTMEDIEPKGTANKKIMRNNIKDLSNIFHLLKLEKNRVRDIVE